MARVKDLFGALGAICNHAPGILEEAENIKAMFSAQKDQNMIDAEFTEPEKTYTLEEVRTALAAKSTAGYRKEVKTLNWDHHSAVISHAARGAFQRFNSTTPNNH